MNAGQLVLRPSGPLHLTEAANLAMVAGAGEPDSHQYRIVRAVPTVFRYQRFEVLQGVRIV